MILIVRAAVIAVSTAIVLVCTWFVVDGPWWSNGNVYDHIGLVTMIAGFWLLIAGAVWLYRWRPAARSWWMVGSLGLTWAAWGAMATSDDTWMVLLRPTWLLRPLVFAIILSWPTGRFTRGDAGWFSIYVAVQVFAMTAWIPLQEEMFTGADNPLGIADAIRINFLLEAFRTSVVMPVGAVLLVASAVRRYRLLPGAVRPIHAPIVVAAIVMALGEAVVTLLAYVPQWDDTEPHSNWFHGLTIFLNFLPYAALPVLLAVAARRTTRLAARGDRIRVLAVGPGGRALPAAIAAALDDPTAVVAYRRNDGAWIDGAGDVVDLLGPGRSATFIERDGEQIAAVEHAKSIDRPTTVELAVAAAGTTIEFERIEAIARSRQAEAVSARRTIIETQDVARRRLERDLHDGAQQRLVGLALQANMAARQRPLDDPDSIVTELRSGVATTRRELHEVAAGVLPALVAERGLHASIATLAATAPMAVEVRIDQPADLQPGVAAAAWFVVSEAVANATKHSGASRLVIVGAVEHDRLDIRVSDDGQGGAQSDRGSGLAGLRDRVARAGGALTVESPAGHGTVVRASFPLAVVS